MIILSARDRQALAAAVGLNEQYLYQCLTRRRPMPVARCPGIERASAGHVTCEALRPDVVWARIPDAAWPHPGGRPCVDMAATAVVRVGQGQDTCANRAA
jgi:hypothetical protein